MERMDAMQKKMELNKDELKESRVIEDSNRETAITG